MPGHVIIWFSPLEFGRARLNPSTKLLPKMYIPANLSCHTGLTYQAWAISFSIFPLAFGNHSFILILILKKFSSTLLLLYICQLWLGPLSLSLLVSALVLSSIMASSWFGDQPPYTQGIAGWQEALFNVSLLAPHGRRGVS